jgi:hypothetical protein
MIFANVVVLRALFVVLAFWRLHSLDMGAAGQLMVKASQ